MSAVLPYAQAGLRAGRRSSKVLGAILLLSLVLLALPRRSVWATLSNEHYFGYVVVEPGTLWLGAEQQGACLGVSSGLSSGPEMDWYRFAGAAVQWGEDHGAVGIPMWLMPLLGLLWSVRSAGRTGGRSPGPTQACTST